MSGPLALTNGTYLVLTPVDSTIQLTPYAARGLTQTYEVITGAGGESGGAWLRRDVNGNLQSVADTRFRKYKSTITCRDGETPCLDNAWIGLTVYVNCAFEFSFPTGGAPARTVVSSRVQGGITYYRPQLIMIIASIKVSLPEYPATYDWQIDLEEV
jgi:hypothetical protein